MPTVKVPLPGWPAGEVSDELEGRIDLETYFKSARRIRNCYVDDKGFIFRREGLEFISQTPSDQVVRLIPFEFNDEQVYLFEFTPGQLRIFEDDVVIQTITTAPIDGLSAAEIQGMDFTQSADTLILVHADETPISITRTGASTFAAVEIALTNIPKFTFIDTAGSGTDEIMRLEVTYSGTEASFSLILEGEKTDSMTFSSTGGAANATILETAFRDLSITSATGITVTNTGNTIYDITFGTDDGDKDWITPEIVDRLGFNSISIGSTTQGEPPQEDVWSVTRGFPVSVTFFEGRLYFGGSGSRPQTLWGSVVGDFFNFNVGTGLDDQAIDVTIDDDEVNAITSVFAGRSLQIFTSGGEFSVFKDLDKPITPTAINIRKQTRHGSKAVRPVSIDGSTVFIEKSGNVIRDFVFNEVEQSFNAPNLSVLASSLVSNVSRMAVRKSVDDASISVTFFINDNGTVAILNKLREQQLRAFSLFTTQGNFEDVAVLGSDEVYFAVQRTVDGNTVRFIEKLNRTHFLDSSVIDTNGTPTTTFTGFDHLDDEEVNVVASLETGELRGPLLDNTSTTGTITTEIPVEEVEAGFFFAGLIETLPIEAALQGGLQLAGDFKRLVSVLVRVDETRDMIVQTPTGKTFKPALRTFGSEVLDQPIPSITDWIEVFLSGVKRDQTVTITQEKPLEFRVLSLMVRVSI